MYVNIHFYIKSESIDSIVRTLQSLTVYTINIINYENNKNVYKCNSQSVIYYIVKYLIGVSVCGLCREDNKFPRSSGAGRNTFP